MHGLTFIKQTLNHPSHVIILENTNITNSTNEKWLPTLLNRSIKSSNIQKLMDYNNYLQRKRTKIRRDIKKYTITNIKVQ